MGVIGAIIPWNYPIHNFLSPVISALFAGNGTLFPGIGVDFDSVRGEVE